MFNNKNSAATQSNITLDIRKLYSSYLCEMIKPWTGWNFKVPDRVRLNCLTRAGTLKFPPF